MDHRQSRLKLKRQVGYWPLCVIQTLFPLYCISIRHLWHWSNGIHRMNARIKIAFWMPKTFSSSFSSLCQAKWVKRLGNFVVAKCVRVDVHITHRQKFVWISVKAKTFNFTCRPPFLCHCHSSIYSHCCCRRCLCIDFFFVRSHRSVVYRISIDFPFTASSYSSKKIQTTNIFPHKFRLCLNVKRIYEKKRKYECIKKNQPRRGDDPPDVHICI